MQSSIIPDTGQGSYAAMQIRANLYLIAIEFINLEELLKAEF